MKLDRKEFIRTALLFTGGGLGLAHLLGCGGDTPSPSGTGGARGTGGTGGGSGTNACATSDPTATIAINHAAGMQHTLTISMADATAGVQRTYGIMGNADHDHTVTISPTNFTMLKSGMTVSITSTSTAGHTHGISVSCA